ncbi:MAG: T9SS type A sorting domain-containing protein, partial [Fibromonadaceae bacterium]|nr:T9SS type A sorting domain-containing protein [Fibromonadaceae bacterium]
LKLSDLALAAGYAWHDPETYLHAGDGQSFAATYLDPSGNYSAAAGTITVNVAKATGVFGISTALDITYTSGLRLSDLALGEGYIWNAPTAALNAGNGQSFPATFTEPSGNYTTATGSITVNVAKAIGTFVAVAAINTTYTQTLKLSNLTLPANYAWETPATALNAGNAQSFSATFTDPSGNYEAATGSVVVNVAKATPAAVTFPTAAGITYDPEVSLSHIAFTGGTGDGTFAWANPWEVPTVINSGFGVVFTPRDQDNYNYTGITMTATVALAVAKANPVSNPPSDLVAVYGQTLAEVHLHEGWEWEVPLTTLVGNAGVRKFPAKFTPPDTDNYENLSGEIELEVHVAKADPTLPATPAGLTATFGQTLASVALPAGWSWATPTALVGNAGTQTHKAKFTPTDVANYNVITGINLSITVSEPTPIRTPQIASSNIHAYAMGNNIVLQNLPSGAKVEVFDLRGRGVACNALAINNTITIPMQAKGIYIVKIGNTPNTFRVAVK